MQTGHQSTYWQEGASFSGGPEGSLVSYGVNGEKVTQLKSEEYKWSLWAHL